MMLSAWGILEAKGIAWSYYESAVIKTT